MDFGVVGLDSLVCPNSENAATNSGFNSVNAAEITKHNWFGSDFLKQEGTLNEGDLRDLKVAKTLFCGQEMLKIPLQRSNRSSNLTEGQQMLSFSSSNSQNVTCPYYCHTSSSPFSRNTGNVSGGLNASSMHVSLTGTAAPFTPSQLMELEHQALIYKYITANVPIPSYLLNPIRKAIEYAGFYSFSCLKSNYLEWNAFHLRFSNTDPEPGRCRRTDGKKWRCSKDAVADQKYCERHMNRGRHRSRKPVEGQPGHSSSTITTTNGKLTPVTSPTFSSMVAAGSVSNSLSGMPNINRSLLDKEKSDKAYQNMTGLSSKINLKDNQYSIPKHQTAYEESSQPEFGFVCSDSLLNPLNRSSSFVNCRNSSISNNPNDHENKSQHSLRLFTDDWPKNQSENSAISCPNSDLQPDRTQLSITIPMVTSNFMSSTSSPMNEKASMLRLSREHKVTQVGIGVGSVASEHRNRQTNGVPISWERSMGGPLAEVLHLKNNSTSDCKNTKSLHLMEGWDNSHQMVSSPTGVLQMGACGSVTSSSTCSSPRGKSSKSLNGINLCNNGLVNPSFPAL